MASKEGICACCDTPVAYTGRIPILCQLCRTARKEIAECSSVTQFLPLSNDLSLRLFLPDEELIPKPVTLATISVI